MKKNKYQDQIDEIMDNFDFNHCFEFMISNYWTGWKPETVEQVAQTARDHLISVTTKPGCISSSSGGFTARRKCHLELTFDIAEWSAEYLCKAHK